MTLFRIDVHKETGTVTLYIEAACGFKPVIGWTNIDGVKEFADMLLDFYKNRQRCEDNKVKAVSNELLTEALGDDDLSKYFEF
jgi:hypothetical protein